MLRLIAKRTLVKQGDVIGTRTVIGMPFNAKVKSDGRVRNRPHAVCRCAACGKTEVVALHGKATRSCFCGVPKALAKANTTHGLTDVGPYFVWKGIKQRCYRVNFRQFKDYGGRGITVCNEWRNDYGAFYRWAMANGYEPGLEIDRIDNDGNYEPSNCRFVPDLVNQRNKRTIRQLTAFGETKPRSSWPEDPRCVVSYFVLRSRLRYGWSPERALTEPVSARGHQ